MKRTAAMYQKSYNRFWFLNFLPIWYATHKLKRLKKAQHWDDDRYYKTMYAIPLLTHRNVGDKLAMLRDYLTDEISKHKATARVIDLATGRGYQARNIYARGYKNVYGSDIQVSRVAEAQQQNSDTYIHFGVADMRRLPYRSDSADAIVVSGALHDLKPAEVETSLKECHRVLRVGGRLIVLEPRYLGDLSYTFLRKAYAFGCGVLDESVNMQDFLKLDLVGLGARIGFTLQRQQTVWHAILSLYTFAKPGENENGSG